ncbi:MAG: hypothetical protein Q7S74_04600, partial [Nanoarchaeota archaeon]|nr:hypothetical protein [Nanoarchaeota archaeon]
MKKRNREIRNGRIFVLSILFFVFILLSVSFVSACTSTCTTLNAYRCIGGDSSEQCQQSGSCLVWSGADCAYGCNSASGQCNPPKANLNQPTGQCVAGVGKVDLSWSGVGENGGNSYWIGIAEGNQLGSTTVSYWDRQVSGTSYPAVSGTLSSSNSVIYSYIVSPLNLAAGKTYTAWIWNGQSSDPKQFNIPSTCGGGGSPATIDVYNTVCSGTNSAIYLSWSGTGWSGDWNSKTFPGNNYAIGISQGWSWSNGAPVGSFWDTLVTGTTHTSVNGESEVYFNGGVNPLSLVPGTFYYAWINNGIGNSNPTQFTAKNCNPMLSCTNECSSTGQTQCSGSNQLTCGNYDADSCLEWFNTASCAYGCNS